MLKGEISAEGAVREVQEEVGITLNPSEGKRIFSKIRENFQDIVDVWLFEYDGELQLEKATTDEVEDCKWMSVDEIRELCDNGKLVHTLEYFFRAFREKESSGLEQD